MRSSNGIQPKSKHNPTYKFCECESSDCSHIGSCEYEPENFVDRNFLADYTVTSFKQTLCPHCANHAFNYATHYGREEFEVAA